MSLSIADQNKLDAFWSYCVKNRYFNIGYPESADFDYTMLERFLRFSINNCGDWGEYCNYLLNSFDFEKEVMEYFSGIFKIPFAESWGYVTNGGTESNMFGCYLGRELFPEGTLYYSKDTHYSVAKIVKLLRIKSQLVESQPDGEMDYDDLINKIRTSGERHPIIFANIGTTVRGAVDNIAEIQKRITALGIPREDYYLHADAALSGMILPFVEDPQPFTFADGIDSIGVSGHKMIGSPIPCGIVVAKKANVDRISVEIDYISAHDKTISGSRNGHTPLMMWAAVRSHTDAEWHRRIGHSLNMAKYAVDRFKAAGIDALCHKNSITVVFPKPSEWVWKKHCLATSGNVAHLITTAHHLDSSRIDALIDDVIADLAQRAA
ncbi:histidine decarboxylase [Klebsiella aerogenes]|uniref:histidine decarboxylase n=1 Tax=Klebsiella aerogenes TaxID=548 RepID=UPI002811CF76|nr:histidine decarboxylase [Klebsiella aerogenes]EIV2083178.1 histidine decarboxylase [Klebsiella aerogenes]EIW9211419.1 histidine decarboxylase [Klebsiella aerogenes]WPR99607.1 histidine decarboxylase [Klebsiella aerogenes]WPS38892.1 histidine decarboxylase [Klebsiella aerogenes]HBS6034265.1 histidine decarboxylase [Klebsiella aerogenes]